MARLDERTEQFLQEYKEKLIELYREDLKSLILYGSAAGSHFHFAKSNLNVLVVLREATADQLRPAAQLLRRFQKRERLEPVFLSFAQLTPLASFYPMELSEMKEQHRILHGENVLGGVSISNESLRLQLMSELLGKSLKLRSLYLEAAVDARRLEEHLVHAVTPYRVLMRTFLKMSDTPLPPPWEYLEIVTQLEERHAIKLQAMRDIYQVKLGMQRLLPEELSRLFEQLLDEAEGLAQRALEILGYAS